MTRIIAGSVGGRRLKVPASGTRPTSDRVREAVFSSLAARIDFDGLRVIDLYAGSGALGIEALSRGAQIAVLVESDAKASRIIRGNIAELALSGAVLRSGTVASVLATKPDQPFDLVFSDPPYALTERAVEADLKALLANGWVADGSFIVLERSARSKPTEWPTGFELLKATNYGETRVELAEVQTASV